MIVVVLTIFCVVSALSMGIAAVDVSDQPEWIQSAVTAVKYVLLSAPVAIGIGFGRNLFGYAINWLVAKRKGDPTVEYEAKYVTETIVKFEGWVLLVTPFIEHLVQVFPGEKQQAAMTVTATVFALISLTLSEVKRILKETKPS